jgi:hypothetical protein
MIVADANLLAYSGVPLVTTDRAVLRAFPERALTPAEFVRV